MKALLLFVLALGLASSDALAAAPGDHIAEISTIRGTTFRKCVIVRIYPDGVSFTHSKGAAKIQFTDLESEWRDELGYDSKKAAAYQKDLAERRKLESERRAQLQQDRARAQILAQEAQIKHLQLLERQYLEAAARRDAAIAQGQGGLLPAVGFPGIYYGPINELTGPVYGGQQWRGRHGTYSTTASIGCGSGGILAYRSSRYPTAYGYSGYHNPARGHGLVTTYASIGCGSGGILSSRTVGYSTAHRQNLQYSPTLGIYEGGKFINYGGFLPIAYGGRQMPGAFGAGGYGQGAYGGVCVPAMHGAGAVCRTGSAVVAPPVSH